MKDEFLDLKLNGPKDVLPLVKKFRKLVKPSKREPKKPRTLTAKPQWPEPQ
jgi:hypothetical protein